MAYCRWLGKVTGKRIELQSEAEWEKAARGATDKRAYPRRGREDLEALGPRVLRGGAFNFDQDSVRCSYRFHLVPYFRYYNVGFRVVFSAFL